MPTLVPDPIAPAVGIHASRAMPVIIATDGRPQSDAAMTLGRAIAGTDDALRLITVMKPTAVVNEAQLGIAGDIDAMRREGAVDDAVKQRDRLWNSSPRVEVRDGDPANEIAALAHATGASLIVAGLGRHRVIDRVFGDETALRLVRVSDVPVLAVDSTATSAPRQILIAVDFSETSLRAARIALELAAPNATIRLAYVAPRDNMIAGWKGGGGSYKRDAYQALTAMCAELRIPEGITVQTVLLQGDPATEILALAASIQADLIATGSHGRGFVGRMLVGSVATRILRCSTCSVLTVPYTAVMVRD